MAPRPQELAQACSTLAGCLAAVEAGHFLLLREFIDVARDLAEDAGAVQWEEASSAFAALRSIPAHGAELAQAVIASGCLESAARFSRDAASGASGGPAAAALRVCLQALGNMSVRRPEETLRACNDGWRAVAAASASPSLLAPVAMALFNCARVSPTLAARVAEATALPHLVASYQSAWASAAAATTPEAPTSAPASELPMGQGDPRRPTHGAPADPLRPVPGLEWLAMLVEALCLRGPHLATVLASLRGVSDRAFVLQLLEEEMEGRGDGAADAPGSVGPGPSRGPQAAQQALQLLEQLTQCLERAVGTAGDDPAELRACLGALRALTQRRGGAPESPSDGAGPTGEAGLADGAESAWGSRAVACGLVGALLDMLHALGSPPGPRARREAHESKGRTERSDRSAEDAASIEDVGRRLPSRMAYFGYRTDLLAVLANVAFGSPAVAEAVVEANAVELVLSQCQVDDLSPMAREWGLFAVRNLCEASVAVQDRIRSMKVQGVEQTDELRRLGLRVEVRNGQVVVEREEAAPPRGD